MWPFIQLIERHSGPYPAEELLGSLAETSLAISQPSTGHVVEWTNEGDRLISSRSEVMRRLALGEQTTFEVWFPAGIGVAVSFRQLEDAMYSLAFGLRALEPDEVGTFVSYSVDRFRALAETSRTSLLVVDSLGETAEYDWYDFVQEQSVPPSVPDVIGLPVERIPDIGRMIRGRRREHAGDYVLVHR